jgi:hypothetical protein
MSCSNPTALLISSSRERFIVPIVKWNVPAGRCAASGRMWRALVWATVLPFGAAVITAPVSLSDVKTKGWLASGVVIDLKYARDSFNCRTESFVVNGRHRKCVGRVDLGFDIDTGDGVPRGMKVEGFEKRVLSSKTIDPIVRPQPETQNRRVCCLKVELRLPKPGIDRSSLMVTAKGSSRVGPEFLLRLAGALCCALKWH